MLVSSCFFFCEDCDDYLDIPEGATEINIDYKIIQKLPYSCCHDEKKGDYCMIIMNERISSS